MHATTPLKTSDGQATNAAGGLPTAAECDAVPSSYSLWGVSQPSISIQPTRRHTKRQRAEALAPPGTNALRQDQILWPDIMSVAHIVFAVAFDTNPLRRYLHTRAIELSTPEAHRRP